MRGALRNSMKAILEIPEKKIKLEFDNFTYDKYRMIGERPMGPTGEMDENYMMVEKYAIGKSIILMTSHMPNDLKVEIGKMIERYCNH